MKEQLLNINLPDKYIEGLIEYVPGLDNEPQWPELQKMGYTWEQHFKFNKLIEIEAMKYALMEDDISREEILEIEKMIQDAIEEYNNM